MPDSLSILKAIAKGGTGAPAAVAYKAPKVDDSFAKQLAALTNAKTPSINLGGGGAAAAAPGKTDAAGQFWHVIGDIIDRPRRAVADTAQGSLHELEALTKVIGGGVTGRKDIQNEGASEILPSLGEALSGIPRGLFSNAKTDQRSTSDIIENETDRAGAFANRANKNHAYKNTADNVNPLLKGGLGLVGDIVSDPLTYVPLPGAGLLGKVFNVGTKVSKDLAKAAPEAEKVLAKAVDSPSATLARHAEATFPKNADGKARLELTTGDPVNTVDEAGNAVRTIGGNKVYEPIPRVSTSMVTKTDPVLKPLQAAYDQIDDMGKRTAHISAMQAVPKFITEHLDDSKYTHVINNKGFKATAAKKLGDAKNTHLLGTFANFNLLKNFNKLNFDAVSKSLINGKPIKNGIDRMNAVADKSFRDLKLGEALLDSKGASMHLDAPGLPRIDMSQGQLYDIIQSHSPEAAQALKLALFNHSTAVPPTKIMEAAVMAYHGRPGEEVLAHLQSIDHRVKVNGKPMTNFLAGTKKGLVTGVKKPVTPEEIARGLMEGIQGGAPFKMRETVAANAAAHDNRLAEEAFQMSDETVANLNELASDPLKLSDTIVALNGIPEQMAAVARRAEALPESVMAASQYTVGSIPPAITVTVHAAVMTGDKLKRGETFAARAAADKLTQDAATEAKSLSDKLGLADGDVGDMGAKMSTQAYRAAANAFMRFADPVSQLFRFDRGMEGTSLNQILSQTSVAKRLAIAKYNTIINGISKTAMQPLVEGQARTVGQEALAHAVAGTMSENPAVAALIGPIAQVMDRFAPTTNGNALSSVFTRTAAPLEWLASRFGEEAKYPGLKQVSIDTDAARATHLESGKKVSELEAAYKQIADQVGNVDDVPEFLHSLNLMGHRAASEAALMGQAEEQLIKIDMGFIGKTADAPAGMARAAFKSDSPLGAFASKELHLTPEGLRAMQSFNSAILPGKASSLDQWLTKYFDPFQQVFKTGVTIVRPGHHVRNAVGNATMNFIAEGIRFARQSQRDTIKIMQGGHYDGFDASKMLGALGAETYKGTGAVLYTTKFAKEGAKTLSAEDFRRALSSKGVLNSFVDVQGLDNARALGGIEGEIASKNLAQKGADALTKNKGIQATAGKLAEANDHLFKIQHAAQLMRKFQHDKYLVTRFGQRIVPKSQDELLTLIAERVRQYHPDGSTLTEFERRYLKRAIPFYSWMRGALPSLAEDALMHPGRATAFTKASYNLAVAAGVHPDSLADPFPTDQIMPSFLTDQVLGPQLKIGGNYFTLSPGIASIDMGNTFAGSAGDTATQLMSPLLRIPTEVATGHVLQTGAAIKDWSSYVDQQLPLVSNVASLTGYSPTGSAAGLATGNGLDETLAAQKGNRTEYSGTQSLLSNLLGVTVTNDSQPNFIKSAEYEQRDKAKAQTLPDGAATAF